MVYQGSKARLRKYIIPILQKCIDDNNIKRYVETFVGGANIIDHIKCEQREGFDANYDLISLLNYMQKDPNLSIAPSDCSVEHYREVRNAYKNNLTKYPREYIALIGYFASYGGRYFDGGYGRDNKGGRSIYGERLQNALKQAPLLKDIKFNCADYTQINVSLFENCVFYLDPPYRNTKSYSKYKINNYEEFYNFARKLSEKNYVFISEYSMPKDFQCIWQKERKVLQKSDRLKADVATEKLFFLRGKK